MKHLFIINPAAGKYDKTGEFTQIIRSVCDKRCLAYEILVSRAPGDCTRIAHAAAATGDPVRIYACGGDGTLNEVVNGVVGYRNAAITHFPGGSGNDFIRIFNEPMAFKDLNRLMDCEIAELDLIRCQREHYSLNVCSVGLDARIGTDVGKYKRLPLVSGSSAYLLSTGVNLIKGLYRHYVLDIDGKVVDGEQTMIVVANGRWYGGGFYAVPVAQPDDGLLDVLVVKRVSRLTVANVIGKFKAGQFEQLPEYITHYRCKKLTVRCDDRSEINLDGELRMGREISFELVPRAIRFFYPRGLSW